MKEVAVLKWHGEGCYATAFAAVREVDVEEEGKGKGTGEEREGAGGNLVLREQDSGNAGDVSTAIMASTRDEADSKISTIQQRRDLKAQTTHWLAAGSKDGNVSLWDIY